MTIPIVYFRSSSFNCHRMCPMQYFIEYTLGVRGKSNKKADKGTITHKILEICALSKKAHQDGLDEFEDEDIGLVFTNKYDPEYLAQIGSRVYQHYTSKWTHHFWSEADYKDCMSWAWKVLKYKNGMFDPANKNIVAAEPHFDFTIDLPWAEYDYPQHGLKGNLALKGTIDVISEEGDGVYEILDYKTGKRLDWATGKEKTQDSLFYDPQLRLYHYAAKHMYPHVKTFIVTIYFINWGGPFTVHFQDEDLEWTENMLRKKFEEIRDTDSPEIIRNIDPKQGWKCKKLCGAGMESFEDPQIEYRGSQYTPWGEPMTKCEEIRYMIKRNGIDWVIENYMDPNHTHGSYGEGGGKFNREKKDEE